jgi:predicted transcriptional regulator
MKVLLSIKPEYAAKIMSGEKRYEFRRRIFQRKGITTVVIYVTSPMKKVIGEFVVGEIIEREVKALWEETRQFGGIEKDAFDNYFIGKNIGFAIEVGQVIKYKRPCDLCDIRPGLAPPQSFAYI